MFAAQDELESYQYCHIDGTYEDTSEIVSLIDDCKKRIGEIHEIRKH